MHCYTSRVNRKKGRIEQIQKSETYQYVPMSKLLKAYLEQPGMMECFIQCNSTAAHNILRSYCDGQYFQTTFHEGGDMIVPLLLYNLTVKEMHRRFIEMNDVQCSYNYYREVFNSLNISFSAQLNDLHVCALDATIMNKNTVNVLLKMDKGIVTERHTENANIPKRGSRCDSRHAKSDTHA